MVQRTVGALALLVVAAALAACGAAVAAGGGLRAGEALRGRALWAGRPFDGYRLVVRSDARGPGFATRCRSDVVVQGGKVRAALANTCLPAVTWTVEGLFTVAGLPEVRACDAAFAGGCACLRRQSVRASFDGGLGYPTRISVTTATVVQWWHPDYWIYLLGERAQPWCVGRAGAFERSLSVERLTPAR